MLGAPQAAPASAAPHVELQLSLPDAIDVASAEAELNRYKKNRNSQERKREFSRLNSRSACNFVG
jgi:hypothetical protein